MVIWVGEIFGVFKIPVALGIGCAESIENPLGEFAQIPTISQFRVLPILVKGDDAAEPIGTKTLRDVGEIAREGCSRTGAVFAHGNLAGGKDQQKGEAHEPQQRVGAAPSEPENDHRADQ